MSEDGPAGNVARQPRRASLVENSAGGADDMLIPRATRPASATAKIGPSEVLSIRIDEPGSFPWQVFHDRHPKLLAQITEAYPYSAAQRRGLQVLLDETLNHPMTPLPESAPDRGAWDQWGHGYFGLPWMRVPFLWAESYFYRRLLGAVEFFEPGPWYWFDPFGFLKQAELTDPALEDELGWIAAARQLPQRERTRALLHASLWGNRADLGFRIGLVGNQDGDRGVNVVADDTETVLNALETGGHRRVALVADNAGREILADLVLIDHLLERRIADTVVLHVKPHPYYVSDATTPDVVACLRRMATIHGASADIAGRLRDARSDGRLELYTHWFYSSPLPFHDLPDDLAGEFGRASLTLLKGDLNYRRLVGDLHWLPTTPFADVASYFPSPVVTLRTLKSDVVVGLDAPLVAVLDTTDSAWRTRGTHGLVQAEL
jgi:hypothetical protein